MTGLARPNADAMLPDLADGADPQVSLSAGLDAIFDVPVKVSAVLGKTRIKVGELMGLGQGAIIALDRKVGEPIDLYVNDRLIARGELVMVDGALGVTMTEIVKDDEA
ncbi:MAG: flagellar motor switch protein FliN [Amphiplicatus sp.]